MLHVNDDNNDELFRKAAEDYLLKAENPDWETLLAKMNTGAPPSIQVNETLTQKKKPHSLFVFFNWSYKKKGHNSAGSFFRIFRFSSWLEKSKKKINGLYSAGVCILPVHHLNLTA